MLYNYNLYINITKLSQEQTVMLSSTITKNHAELVIKKKSSIKKRSDPSGLLVQSFKKEVQILHKPLKHRRENLFQTIP